MHAELADLLSSARVVSLPLVTPFRGITVREALVFEGPAGWSEFSPFLEYDDVESAAWLAAAIEFAYTAAPSPYRSTVPVNATLPAVGVARVAAILDRFGRCRTVKVKVGEAGQTLAEDVARVAETRQYLGADGRIRVDANGNWNVDEAEHAFHALAKFDLEFVEQPCATIDELAQLRTRIKYMGIPIAADESVRKAADPLEVARSKAADILVIKAQPLGGIRAALQIAADAGLPVVVSSGLETTIGISMGLHLAASIEHLDFDCGLATASLFATSITDGPPSPIDGQLAVARIAPSPKLLGANAAAPDRTAWWLERLSRCYRLLYGGG
jgi:O-succinylbenzoate synthase